MSHGSLLMGTSRAKLGNMVLYRRRGKEIQRAKVTPSNPKSMAQCKQRMAFATVQGTLSALKEIVNHSFEGVEYGGRSLEYFMQLNMPLARAYRNVDAESPQAARNMAFLIKGAKAMGIMPWQVSDGSLNFPALTYVVADDCFGINGSSLTQVDVTITDAEKYRAVLAKLSLVPGDQITAIIVQAGNGAPAATYGEASNPKTYTTISRFVFKKAEDIDFTAPFQFLESTTAGYQFNKAVCNLAETSNWYDVVELTDTTIGTTANCLAFTWPNHDNTCMACVIRSQRSGADWKRSSSNMALAIGGDYEPDAPAYQVWPSYSDQVADNESPYYLNQAEQVGNEVPGTAGSGELGVSIEAGIIDAGSMRVVMAVADASLVGSTAVVTVVKNGSVVASGGTMFNGSATQDVNCGWQTAQSAGTYAVTVTCNGLSKTQNVNFE